MGRRLLAAALCVLVHSFVVTSPLVHAHPDDHGTGRGAGHSADSHHHSTPVHAHLGGHGPVHHEDGPSVTSEHDNAVYLPLFVSKPLAAFDLPVAIAESFAAVNHDETAGYIVVAVTHGHDPPDRSASSPRGPPVFPTFI